MFLQRKIVLLCLTCLSLLLVYACKDDLKINGKPKDIISVYGVLNATDSVQYIRVAKAFLTESNALDYAKANDITVNNAQVTLTTSDTTIIFFAEPAERDSGLFTKNFTLYKANFKPEPGIKYELNVVITGDSTISTRAYTIVPSEIDFFGADSNFDYVTQQYEYPDMKFEDKGLTIDFRAPTPGVDKNPGAAYDLKISLSYGEKPYTQGYKTVFVPSPAFTKDQYSCEHGVCFPVGRTFYEYFISELDNNKIYYSNDSVRSRACVLEVTSIDTFLYNYIRVNNAGYNDFTTVKPEYSNIEGGVGIFGSINIKKKYVQLTDCFMHLVGLNERDKPVNCKLN